ncbi:MAG: hypothetical protein KKD77_20890 [Gammaproteobacteria bacterium]|nr:hypothetical protein [Gammaproteobacteria bacterium]
MDNWYGSTREGFVFPPKLGESKTIEIIGGKRVEEPGHEWNLKKKGNIDSGFHLQLDILGGNKFVVNTWSLFFAFRDFAVRKGDTIEIQHPEKGKYIIKKLSHKDIQWEDDEENIRSEETPEQGA